SGREPKQRTGRQLLAGAIVLEQLAALVVFQQTGRSADKQMPLKYRSAGKRCWRVDPGKGIVRRAVEPHDGEAMLPLELQLLLRRPERFRRFPVNQAESSQRGADQYSSSEQN